MDKREEVGLNTPGLKKHCLFCAVYDGWVQSLVSPTYNYKDKNLRLEL